MSSTKKSLFSPCYSYIKENRYKIALIFLIYLTTILSIGIVNFPYIDDCCRQTIGVTDFQESYCRWGSEISSWIVNGSRHLTDMGLTTHILTAVILAFSSIIAVYVLNDKKFSWVSSICSTLIGLNPWFLQCISFRFDSPYMSLSILASIFPFLWWEKSKKSFFVASILGIFLMCNTYQASSGIYIIMTIALVFKDLINNHKLKDNYKKYFLSIIAYITAMIFYFVELKLWNNFHSGKAEQTTIASIIDIPATVIRNVKTYFKTIYNQSARIWVALFVFIILIFIVSYIYKPKTNYIKNALFVFLYLTLGSVFSYGVYLIFATNLIQPVSTRYYYGFGIFVAITLIILSNRKISFNVFNLTKNILLFTFVYYIFSFNLTYASMLSYQKEEFERQSVVFISDIKNVVNDQRKTIYANKMFKDSPVFTNTARNYPILNDLIYSKSLINFWPNVWLFNTYSGLNVNMCAFDFSNFDSNDKKLEISNYYYDIFTTSNEIFVFMK